MMRSEWDVVLLPSGEMPEEEMSPSRVTDIKVAPGADQKQAVLSWSVPADNVGVTAYEVVLENGQKFSAKTNSITLKKLSAGRHTATVMALDKEKNRSEGTAFDFDVADITAPKTGKVSARQTSSDTVELSMTGFTDDVGIGSYRVYLDGKLLGTTDTERFYYRRDNLAGKLTFSVTAVDAAGNESKAGKANITIRDVVAPDRVTGVSAEVAGTNAVIRWNEASDNVGVVSYDVVIDGRHFATKTNSYVFKNVVPGVNYQVTVAAVDKEKNVGQASTALTFGAAVPEADVTPPGKVSAVKVVLSGTDATVSWAVATDNVGVVSYEITVNDRKYSGAGTSLALKKLAAGTYNVTVRAVDAAGNVGAPSDVYSFECAAPAASSARVRLHTDGVVVESAASMSNKSVASNQFLVAESGGTVVNTVVNGGTLLVSNGAVATDTTINSGQGSAANAAFATLTMNNGYLTVLDGGTAGDVTLNGGALIVRDSGSVRNNRVFSGSVDVSSGGAVLSTAVGSGVYIRVGERGSALDTVLADGAHAVVYSGGFMSGGAVSGGAGITVQSGGSMQNMRVLVNGSAYVSNGATVYDLQLVGDYVKFQLGIDSATNVHFISSGIAHSVVDGVLSGITAHLHTYLEVSSGGLVKDVRLGAGNTSSGGAVEIFSGGSAENLANHNYGQINVFSGGFLSAASTDAYGEIYLYGGAAAGLRAESNGYIWIHSGGVASKVDVTSAGELTISSGGSAAEVTIMSKGHAMVEESNAFMTDVDIHSSGILEVCGGNASRIIVRKDGILTFSSGFNIMDGPWKQSLNGQAGDVVLSGGTMAARYTGSACRVTALSGAEVQVSSGSLVDDLTLCPDAYAVVNSGGVLNDADISSGAHLDLMVGASASALRISSGASVYLQYAPGMELAGRVDGVSFAAQNSELSGYIQNHGVLDLDSGTTGRDLQILGGGRLNISGGASADGVVIAAGGLGHVYGNATDVETAGELHVAGSVGGMEINGDYTHIHSGGIATGVTLNSGGGLLIYSGGRVDDLAMPGNGSASVNAGATLCGLRATGDSYKLTLNSGSLLTGNICLETDIMVYSGARIDFDITVQSGAGETALITGLDHIGGYAGNYTVSVAADQAPGTYVLASCTDTVRKFRDNIEVWIDSSDAGFLNLDAAAWLQTEDRRYSLSQTEDGTLLLDIAAGRVAECAPPDDFCDCPAVSGVDFAELAVAVDDEFTSLPGTAESLRSAMLASFGG